MALPRADHYVIIVCHDVDARAIDLVSGAHDIDWLGYVLLEEHLCGEIVGALRVVIFDYDLW